MKAAIRILSVVCIVWMSSCNKEGDWKCTCNVDGKQTDFLMFDTKKKEAKRKCNDLESNTTINAKNCRLGKED